MIYPTRSDEDMVQVSTTQQAPLNSYITLTLPETEIPPDAWRFLALVLSPANEVGMLAARTNEVQYINADAALLATDVLLSLFHDLLPHASPEFMQHEAGRVMRLRNAHQASDLTRRRQRRHEEAASAPAQEPQGAPEGAGNVSME